MNRDALFRCVFWINGGVMLAFPAWAVPETGDLMQLKVTLSLKAGDKPVPQSPKIMVFDACVSRQHDPRDMVQHREDCTFSSYQHAGNSASFHAMCRMYEQEGGDPASSVPMDGTAHFVISPAGKVQGTIRFTGRSHAQPLEITMDYEGMPTGACDLGARPSGH